jgi:ribosome maturation factor RimP
MKCYGARTESGLTPTFLFGLLEVRSGVPRVGVSVKESRPVVDRVHEIVSPILWTMGLELVDVECVGQGSRTVVRVYIDKPGGVTVRDCEQAHVALSPALDVNDPFPHPYTLEVSSPGLDRPFKRLQDYRRAVGAQVSVKLKEPIAGQWRITGVLAEVNEQAMTLMISEPPPPRSIKLDFGGIAEARRVVTF